uniref:Uncharacterized protein n=1 Tax=Lygus hesperus TaxID=30085 RepID=A0A0A9VVF4_LYGHE
MPTPAPTPAQMQRMQHGPQRSSTQQSNSPTQPSELCSDPNTEFVASLQSPKRCDSGVQDTLDSILLCAERTTRLGDDALLSLHMQQEQFNAIEDNLDYADHSLYLTQRLIHGMGSIFHAVSNALTTPRSPPLRHRDCVVPTDVRNSTSQLPVAPTHGGTVVPQAPLRHPADPCTSQTQPALTLEDQKLTQIEMHLQHMKQQSLSMQEQLREQCTHIRTISNKADSVLYNSNQQRASIEKL